MTTPIRLTAVLTHPIQYYAPWFRHITANAPQIDLTVVHATEPTPEQQGVGFGRSFTWDVPLTEGYRSVTVRPAREGERIDSEHLMGLDVEEIGDAVAATRPDVVLITGWYSITLLRALATARRLRVPAIYRGDSHLFSGPSGWRRPLWSLKTRTLLHQFKAFASPGRRVSEYLRWFGVPEYRIFNVPHGIDNDMFAAAAAPYQDPDARATARREWGIDPDAFVPLFVGKLIWSKRPQNIVRAAARVGPGTTIMIVGSGPLEQEIVASAKSSGVDVRMMGFLNQHELGRAYAIADCLTLPSDFPETWGLVVNEALSTGLPAVVSAAVGCVPDLIRDGVTGYSYPLDDVEALAHRLDQIRTRKASGYDWKPACRERVAQYSFDAMTAGLVRACRSAIAHSTGPEPSWASAPQRILACCGQMVIAGGLERMTFRAISSAVEHGAAAHCIVNDWENYRITPLAEAAGASWSTGPYWYPLTRHGLTPLKVLRMIVEMARVSADTMRHARRVRATHVFLPDFQTTLRNLPALACLQMRGVRTVARLGNAPEPGRFNRWMWRVMARVIDLFVCNSSFSERELLAHGISERQVKTIPNVLAPRADNWRASGERIPGRIIFVGQIIPEKGVDLLLDAVALVRARVPCATLDVVGDMDGWEAPVNEGFHARLRRRADAPDLRGAVTFLGLREDVPSLMARSSIHCCPSRPEQREGFGNVVLEAKMSSLPSVVTPSGHLPELVAHRISGWVCEVPTAEAIAEGLAFYLSDAEALARASAAARASADSFDAVKFDRAWKQVFA